MNDKNAKRATRFTFGSPSFFAGYYKINCNVFINK